MHDIWRVVFEQLTFNTTYGSSMQLLDDSSSVECTVDVHIFRAVFEDKGDALLFGNEKDRGRG